MLLTLFPHRYKLPNQKMLRYFRALRGRLFDGLEPSSLAERAESIHQ